MRLKLYRAATIAQAMSQVRADLGPDALILSTRRLAEGVELTAATEPDGSGPEAVGALPPEPAVDLVGQGLPSMLATQLTGPDLVRRLEQLLRFGRLPQFANRMSSAGRLLLVGLPGAGKTLAIARLATQSVLAGGRPAVITTDGRRAGAAEQLAAYTRLLGLELMVASTPAGLRRALATPSCREGTSVLIDTSGLNPFATSQMRDMAELAEAAEAAPVLVMAAGQDAAESAEQAAAFAESGTTHIMVTRLDLARRLGGLVAAAHHADLTLTLGCGSPCATVPPEPITASSLAARLQAKLSGYMPQASSSDISRNQPPVFPKAGTLAINSWSGDRHAERC